MPRTMRRHAEPPAPTAERPVHAAPASPDQGISPAPVSHHWHVTIAPSTVVLAGVVFWTLFLVGFFVARFIEVLLTIFLAVLFSTFLTPIVNRLEKLHIPRTIGILLVYLAIFGGVVLVGFLGVISAVHHRRYRLVFMAPLSIVYLMLSYSVWIVHGLKSLFTGREFSRDKPTRYANVVA